LCAGWELQLPKVVLIQFVSPDDEHEVIETCRELQLKINIERNLWVTLVIYQESLHDARSTKCKKIKTLIAIFH